MHDVSFVINYVLVEWSHGLQEMANIMDVCGMINVGKEIRYMIEVVDNQG